MHDSRNTFWVGTSLGVYRRGPGDALFQRVAASLVFGFAEDPNGGVWISDRERGFSLLEQASQRADASARRGAPGRWMRSDAAGSLWVSTRGSGLWRVRTTSPPSTAPSVERLTRREGLPSNEIHCLFEDRHGTLWIGTRMGLSRLQASNVRATLVGDALVTSVTRSARRQRLDRHVEGVRRRIGNVERSYGVEHGLPSQRVTSLYEDLSGTMWVATSQGVVRFANERFVPIAGSQTMRLESVWSMTSDRTGVLWLCDQVAGLVHWKDGQLTPFDKALAREGAPHVAYADSEDRVWVGLWTTGVTSYTHQRATRYSVNDGLPPGTVNVFHQDRRGTIWVGTSHGLGRFDDGRFVTFTAQGFPQSSIVSITEDEQGYLWLGSPQGLVRVSLDELDALKKNPAARVRYKLYGSEEGVPGTLGRPGMPSSTREANGRLWFVTSVGLAVVAPGNLHETIATGAGTHRERRRGRQHDAARARAAGCRRARHASRSTTRS
jgi:ligand-binding sensor domain-containing protein